MGAEKVTKKVLIPRENEFCSEQVFEVPLRPSEDNGWHGLNSEESSGWDNIPWE